jgi:hypothetical protein
MAAPLPKSLMRFRKAALASAVLGVAGNLAKGPVFGAVPTRHLATLCPG